MSNSRVVSSGRVEMPRDQFQGAVQILDESSPARFIETAGWHGEAELDQCHRFSVTFLEDRYTRQPAHS